MNKTIYYNRYTNKELIEIIRRAQELLNKRIMLDKVKEEVEIIHTEEKKGEDKINE